MARGFVVSQLDFSGVNLSSRVLSKVIEALQRGRWPLVDRATRLKQQQHLLQTDGKDASPGPVNKSQEEAKAKQLVTGDTILRPSPKDNTQPLEQLDDVRQGRHSTLATIPPSNLTYLDMSGSLSVNDASLLKLCKALAGAPLLTVVAGT